MQSERSHSLTEPLDFLGRHQELHRFFEYFQPCSTPAINIIGLWGSGKTALLHHARHPTVLSTYLRERADRYCLVFVDMHDLHTPEEFSDRIIRQITKVVGVRPEQYDMFWLERLQSTLEQIEDRRVVALLDRFDLLFEEEAFEDEFFGALRSLIDKAMLACVTTSCRSLDECWLQVRQFPTLDSPYRATRRPWVPPPRPSPLYNVFQQIWLGAMEPGDLDELITCQAGRAGMSLTHTDLTWIKKTAGGLPKFVHLATQELIEAYRGRVPAPEHQQEANTKFGQQARVYLNYIWNTLTEDEQKVLRLLISADSTDWPAYKREHGQSAFQSLRTYGLITGASGDCAINGEILAEWVRYLAPPPRDPVDNDTVTALQEIIRSFRRRLFVHEERRAREGINTPPEVIIEVEDLQREIAKYEQLLREILG